ncbi:hypothetical protein Alsa1_CDS0175 [Staphylococcus phage Alsa_1]|nr:hypothetical protein Alsa1_CDS0175 [Staphylococcus phage Alsa_1]WNM56150.1 hypothetical protein CoNPh38_CDS0274 [Staphylococcus phage S-CoN_Ph38]
MPTIIYSELLKKAVRSQIMVEIPEPVITDLKIEKIGITKDNIILARYSYYDEQNNYYSKTYKVGEITNE